MVGINHDPVPPHGHPPPPPPPVTRRKTATGRLKRNAAVGARDDGFEVESRSARLTRNEGRRNGGLGIAAVRGVIDGGGNVARHNGDPRQCTNIVCR
jgi:hypothetical protein